MSGIVKHVNSEELLVNYLGNADTHTTTDTTDVQIFTTTGSSRTWARPSWVNTVYIEVIGGGGGGGSGDSGPTGVNQNSGGGGGGSAIVCGSYPANSLPSILTVTVGATAAGGAISAGEGGTWGTAGNNSSVTGGNFTLTAYGGGDGGGGGVDGSNNNGGGGGGGGTGGHGTNVTRGSSCRRSPNGNSQD